MKDLNKQNVALVYDRLNKIGGAERVLLALKDLFPDAVLYSAVFNPRTAGWAKVFKIHTTFMQHIPYAKNHHEFFPWLTPFAFEQFNFDRFDLVISITSAEAKNIITKPETCHICYCLTPTRYLWSGYSDYQRRPGLGRFSFISRILLKKMLPMLRSWDLIAGTRPDYFFAISNIVARRIEDYYKRKPSAIIYPPVDTDKFNIIDCNQDCSYINPHISKYYGRYFLTVGRMVTYKKLDLLIEVFNRNGKPLVIIGSGKDHQKLKKMAKYNIFFVKSDLTDVELVHYYNHCRAFIFAGSEDFGLVAAEAQSCGRPVIAYRESGMSEIVSDRKTGVLFRNQTVSSIQSAIDDHDMLNIKPETCRAIVIKFNREHFLHDFRLQIEKTLTEYTDKFIN